MCRYCLFREILKFRLFILNDFQRDAAFLILAQKVALGVEAAEQLAQRQVVAAASSAQAGEEGRAYENNFFAAG